MVQQIKIITRPSCEFDISASEGYRLYSSLLSCMQDADSKASSLVHDSVRSSIHLSCLKGRFFRSDRPNFKRVAPGERYDRNILKMFESLGFPFTLAYHEYGLITGIATNLMGAVVSASLKK